jgi:hypothetical protein
MGPGGAQQRFVVGRQPKQPRARLPLAGRGGVEVRPLARADLDLGLDQVPGHRRREHLVFHRERVQLPKAVRQRARRGIQDLELLFESDGVVLGGLEDLS